MPKFRDYPNAQPLTGQEYAILSQAVPGTANTVNTVKINLDVLFMDRIRTLSGRMHTAINGINADLSALSTRVDNINVGSGTANGTVYVEFDPASINANIASLRSIQTSYSTALSSMSSDVSSLSAAQQNTANAMYTIITTQNNMANTITLLQTNVSGMSNTISTLQSQYNTLSSTVVNANTVALEGNVASVKALVLAVQNTVSGMSNTISVIQGNLAFMSANVTSLQSSITFVTSNVATLQANASAQQISINALTDNVSSLSTTMVALSSNVSSVRASVNALQNNVTTNTTAISGLQSNVNILFTQNANNVTIQNSAPKNVYRFSGVLSISGLLAVGKQLKTVPVPGVKPGDAVVVTPTTALPTAFTMGEAFVSANDTLSVAIYVGALITIAATTANLDVVVLR